MTPLPVKRDLRPHTVNQPLVVGRAKDQKPKRNQGGSAASTGLRHKQVGGDVTPVKADVQIAVPDEIARLATPSSLQRPKSRDSIVSKDHTGGE